MRAHDEFWLQVHDMAFSLNSDEMATSDRVKILSGYLDLYPVVAKRQLGEDFRYLLTILTALEPVVRATPVSQSSG